MKTQFGVPLMIFVIYMFVDTTRYDEVIFRSCSVFRDLDGNFAGKYDTAARVASHIISPIFVEKYNLLASDLIRMGGPNGMISWSLQDGKAEDVITWRKGEMSEVTNLSQDKEKLVAISSGGIEGPQSIGCYLFKEKKWIWKVDLPQDHWYLIWFVQGRNQIAAVGREYLYFIDSENGTIIKKENTLTKDYRPSGGRTMHVNVSRSGRYLIIWNRSEDRGDDWFPWLWPSPKAKQMVTVWNVIEEKPAIVFKKPEGELDAATFSQDEQYIILSNSDGNVRLWSIEKNNSVKEVRCGSGSYMISSDEFIVLGKRNGATLLRYPDLVPAYEVDGIGVYSYNPPQLKIAISTNGKLLAFQRGCKWSLCLTESQKELWSVWICSQKPE